MGVFGDGDLGCPEAIFEVYDTGNNVERHPVTAALIALPVGHNFECFDVAEHVIDPYQKA